MSDEAFEEVLVLPNSVLLDEARTLIGFERRYERLRKDLSLLADQSAVESWAKTYYGSIPPIVDRLRERYPLFIFEGDVGTGKTAFAGCAASRLCSDLDRDGNFYSMSTRVRGSGKVGEASTRINEAFARIIQDIGKSRLGFILIDEADSLVTARGIGQSHLEDKIAVNTVLQKLNEVRRLGGRVLVFLATNRYETLDAAVIRRAAAIETFARPTTEERRELFIQDLAGLGLLSKTIDDAVSLSGATKDDPAHTFSDLRTRIIPRILSHAFPDRKINDEDVLAAVRSTPPSPIVR